MTFDWDKWFQFDCIIFNVGVCQIITDRSKPKHRWRSSSSSVLASATVPWKPASASAPSVWSSITVCLRAAVTVSVIDDDLLLYYCFFKCVSASVNGCRQNESLIKNITLIHSPSVKYESIIHNNSSSSEEVFWSESREKSADQAAFTRQNSSKHICCVDFDERDDRRWTFSLEEEIIMIINSYLR